TQQANTLQPHLHALAASDIHGFEIGNFSKTGQPPSAHNGGLVLRIGNRDASRIRQGSGVHVHHDAVVTVFLDGLDEGLCQRFRRSAESVHRNSTLARGHHEVVQHDRTAVGPLSGQNRLDALKTIHFSPRGALAEAVPARLYSPALSPGSRIWRFLPASGPWFQGRASRQG